MLKSGFVYKPTLKELIEARRRRSKNKDKGSNDRYNKHLYDEFKKTKVLRNRANSLYK